MPATASELRPKDSGELSGLHRALLEAHGGQSPSSDQPGLQLSLYKAKGSTFHMAFREDKIKRPPDGGRALARAGQE